NKVKGEYYLTDVVEFICTEKGIILSSLADPDSIIGINSRKDLAKINKLMNTKKLNELMENGVTIIDPNTTFVDEDAVILKDTIIYPSTVIEGDVKVAENCKIGPFARLRSGSKLEENVEVGNFVEVCRTYIGKGTKVKHHTYLGDAVIGENVNIGAGVITANYDGKNKNRTTIEDGAFIGVGARLIAPISIGKNAVVGAGSVVTKGKNVAAGTTVIGIPAKEISNKNKK
ncbi:MAG: UDP-N-acetylglucosamine pyrophosphorylase, partial [Candidatus Omnitrophica bacterium]|nr:UDP-N-acetylglucosamine pyrophosphorylase [Candidatus Omnitrophota bacterium]